MHLQNSSPAHTPPAAIALPIVPSVAVLQAVRGASHLRVEPRASGHHITMATFSVLPLALAQLGKIMHPSGHTGPYSGQPQLTFAKGKHSQRHGMRYLPYCGPTVH